VFVQFECNFGGDAFRCMERKQVLHGSWLLAMVVNAVEQARGSTGKGACLLFVAHQQLDDGACTALPTLASEACTDTQGGNMSHADSAWAHMHCLACCMQLRVQAHCGRATAEAAEAAGHSRWVYHACLAPWALHQNPALRVTPAAAAAAAAAATQAETTSQETTGRSTSYCTSQNVPANQIRHKACQKQCVPRRLQHNKNQSWRSTDID
jgi:hypothetical protein